MTVADERAPLHILIYGPPAAGKLTVAERLANEFGLRVLDNHLSTDPALRLFRFGTPELRALVETIRVALLSAAARARLDVVSTLVFSHPNDRCHIERLVEASESEGAQMRFVQLLPRRDVLESRVVAQSRRTTQKLLTVRQLAAILESEDLATPINPGDLSIDNSELDPAQVVEEIAAAFSLQRVT